MMFSQALNEDLKFFFKKGGDRVTALHEERIFENEGL